MTAQQVYLDLDLTPQPSGYFAYFAPNTTVLDPTDGITLTDNPQAVVFNGTLQSALLYATDNANMSPSGWAYNLSFSQNPLVPGNPAPLTNFQVPVGPLTYTATNANPCVVTPAYNATFTSTFPSGLPNGTGVEFTSGTPAGFTVSTTYYIVNGTATTFQLAATRGGSAIASTGTGSGNLQVTRYAYSGLAPLSQAPAVSPYTSQSYVTARTIYLNAASYGVDSTGATDSTTAIQNAINAAGSGTVVLAKGTYLLNSAALTLSNAGCTVRGEGPAATVVSIGASFSGAAAFVTTAANCSIADMTIAGASSTTTNNPACDAIDLNGGRFCRVDNIFFQYVNGWCVNATAQGSNAGLATMMTRLSGLLNAGGVSITSNTSATWGAQMFMDNLNFQQIGVATGANANLDVFRFTDCWDILANNFNASISDISTGSSINVVGNCASLYFTNMDIGCYSNTNSEVNNIIRIQDGANGSPSDVRFVQGEVQQGANGLYMTGGCKHIWFTSFRFFNNFTNGVHVASTGPEVVFANCSWSLNGQAGVAHSGTYYDLTWTGAATGKVINGQFSSPIVAVGVNGVQNTMDFTGAGIVTVADCNCYGTGTTSGNAFSAGTPKYVFRTLPFNPKGSTAISVPSSGSAASGRNFDMIFYITAGSGSTCSCVVTGASNFTYVVPANATAQIFVPAGATLTPTYTSAPTWVVYGN